MARLIVSFDIEYDDARSYTARYNAFTAAVTRGLPEKLYWAETTSFYVVQSTESALTFARRVATQGLLRPTKDKLLVCDAYYQNGAIFGPVNVPRLRLLIPYIQKI